MTDADIGVVDVTQPSVTFRIASRQSHSRSCVGAVSDHFWRSIHGKIWAAERLEVTLQHRVLAQRLGIAVRCRPVEHARCAADCVDRFVARCHFSRSEHLFQMYETRHVESVIFICRH